MGEGGCHLVDIDVFPGAGCSVLRILLRFVELLYYFSLLLIYTDTAYTTMVDLGYIYTY